MSDNIENNESFKKRFLQSRKFKVIITIMFSAFCISVLALYMTINKFITPELLDLAMAYGFLSNSQVADINNASQSVKHFMSLIFSNARFTYYYTVTYIYIFILLYIVYKLYKLILETVRKLKHTL